MEASSRYSSKFLTHKYNKKLNVQIFMSGILGDLVSITAVNAICRPWEALLIGFFWELFACCGKLPKNIGLL